MARFQGFVKIKPYNTK